METGPKYGVRYEAVIQHSDGSEVTINIGPEDIDTTEKGGKRVFAEVFPDDKLTDIILVVEPTEKFNNTNPQ